MVADDLLDDLKERFAEWIVTSPVGLLPAEYRESYILSATGDRHRARLVVRDAGAHANEFATAHGATIEARPLNLEALFPLLVGVGVAAPGGVATP